MVIYIRSFVIFGVVMAVSGCASLREPLMWFKNAPKRVKTDLLIVGGTESGCAAAIQAARMGVRSITIVNDIEWLGGQFSAEALVAIDENSNQTGVAPGVRHQLPIPRSGLFKETVERIEAVNLAKYGMARPGNTRVNTTCRPADAEKVFREMIAEYPQIRVFSFYQPNQAKMSSHRNRVLGMRFESVKPDRRDLLVTAKITIDASDWGDAIKASGAAYEFGVDTRGKYGEPEAPRSLALYPKTDMNPVTMTMIVEETDREQTPIPRPAHYDSRNYTTAPMPLTHEFFYSSRRVIDRYAFEEVTHPDVILLCTPSQDYPFDHYPTHVVMALEATESGACRKNIVEMTPRQREIIFADARNHSLGLFYYLQTEHHEKLEDKTHSFRRFKLSDEFGTPDKMPWKPYVREGLRLKAMHMMRQQETMGYGDVSENFAKVMYPDAIAVWQFEYDYHPTMRHFLDDNDPSGAWTPKFRPLRNWGAALQRTCDSSDAQPDSKVG